MTSDPQPAPQSHRRWRSLGAALALLALLIQAAVALIGPERRPAAEDWTALLGGICAADAHTATPAPQPEPAGHDHHEQCCLAACAAVCSAAVALTPVGPDLRPPAPVIRLGLRIAALGPAAATAPGRPFPARGPPLA